MNIRRIVVGLDDSEHATRAAAWAADLARVLDAEVIAVHALGLLHHTAEGAVLPSDTHRDEIRVEFEQLWCASVRDRGVQYRAELREGEPSYRPARRRRRRGRRTSSSSGAAGWAGPRSCSSAARARRSPSTRAAPL